MKVIFGAHGSILQVFCALDLRLRGMGFATSSAYWISDSQYYFANYKRFAILSEPSVEQLYEWDFTSPDGENNLDQRRRDALDAQYGAFDLWKAILADRRLIYGRLSKVRQSYAGHYSHEALCTILYSTLDALDRLVDRITPDAIVTFVPASYGDYLLALIAKVRSIRYLQLRSTKVKNFVTFTDGLGALSGHIAVRYGANLKLRTGYPYEEAATAFIKQASQKPVDYEGTIVRTRPPLSKMLANTTIRLAGAIRNQFWPLNHTVACDNHVPPPLGTYFHGVFLQAWYQHTAMQVMRSRMLTLEKSREAPYLFYPLHSEPEIALSIYGRDHQNQIETIRRLAQSIPLRWRLVVKEHPRSVGYRTSGYYRRLLEIPNVWFADPETRPFYWIEGAQAVATVSGFAGFEALMMGRPVIVLGDVAFSVLPRNMLRTVGAMSEVSSELADLLKEFRRDESALCAFVAACMQEGVAVNLYSDLLAKPGRNRTAESTVETQYDNLANHLANRLSDRFDPNEL